MEQYSVFKLSPTTGSRIYSSTEIAEQYGISANLLNKVLVKLGVFEEVNNSEIQTLKLTDKYSLLGEELHFDTSKFKYVNEQNDNTTNITIKFSELGKQFIELLLDSTFNLHKYNPEINDSILESHFPEGKFALSIRLPGHKQNPNSKKSRIYISYRASRDKDDNFSQDYMYITDDAAKLITNDFAAWRRAKNKTKTKYNFYWMERDNSPQALKIMQWKTQYFNSIMKSAKLSIKLSDSEIKDNKDILLKYIGGLV